MDTMGSDMRRALNMPEEMVKKLHQPTRRYVKNARAVMRTPADIYEHPSHYSFILDMPGLEASNIQVKVGNGILHVSGKKKTTNEPPGKLAAGDEVAKPIRIERRRARYLRKFTLPADSNPDVVKATYREGVLTIDAAKKKQSKPKTFTVPIS